MPSFSSWTTPARRSLGDHLERLGRSLEGLGAEVRQAIARALSRAVTDAVDEAVHALLDRPYRRPISSSRSPYPSSYSGYGGAWDESEDVYGSGPRRYEETDEWDQAPYGRYAEGPWDDDDEEPPPGPPTCPESPKSPPSAVPQAVAVGCQAAAWWLQRRRGQVSVLTALGVGLAAGLGVFIRSSVLVAGTGVVVSALGLIALVDTARSSTTRLADTTRP